MHSDEPPAIGNTVSLYCDDKVFCVSSPQGSDNSMFESPDPLASPFPSPSEESHSSSISLVPAGTCKIKIPAGMCKGKRTPEPKHSSVSDETVHVLKSCTSEPVKKDIPYACGIMVENALRMYPENQHVELAMRLTNFLGKLQEEVKTKNKA